jgi:hypothetical protein
MISSPESNILHVKIRSRGSDMHQHVSCNAGSIDGRIPRNFWTLRNLKIGYGETANPDMHIPHARRCP